MENQSSTINQYTKLRDLSLLLPDLVSDDSVDIEELSDCVKQFIKSGGDLNYQGGLLMIIICRTDNLKALKVLVEFNISLETEDGDALSIAADMKSLKVLEYLLQNKANEKSREVLVVSMAYQRIKAVKELVDKHLPKNVADKNNEEKQKEKEKHKEDKKNISINSSQKEKGELKCVTSREPITPGVSPHKSRTNSFSPSCGQLSTKKAEIISPNGKPIQI